jgi:uncharacterized membrane protein
VFAKNAAIRRRRTDGELSSPENIPPNIPEEYPANVEPDLVECPDCGAGIQPDAAFCPDCRWPLRPPSLEQRAIATVAYLPLLPAAVILFLPAFRKENERFVRFHAWQSISLWTVFFVLTLAALLLSNVAAAMACLLFGILVSLAMVFLWIVLSLKAWQGERFELPLFGLLGARMR